MKMVLRGKTFNQGEKVKKKPLNSIILFYFLKTKLNKFFMLRKFFWLQHEPFELDLMDRKDNPNLSEESTALLS